MATDSSTSSPLHRRRHLQRALAFLDSGVRRNDRRARWFVALRCADSHTTALALGIAAALILAAGFLVYAPGLSGPFLFDDFPNIVYNEHLKIPALTLDQLMSAAFSSKAGPLYRPIAMASFAINAYFSGMHPYWFKFTNLMIHLLCGLLVITLSRLLLASYREQRAPWLSETRVRWVAMLLAAAWIVHPLNLTAVLYVVQRMVTIASLFMLASVCLYVIGRRRQLDVRTGWPLIWLAAPAAAVIGLFGKEIAVLTPLYLVVIEAVIFRFKNNRGDWDKPIIVFYMLGLIIPVLCGSVWLLVHSHQFLGGYSSRTFTITQRLMTEARVLILDIKWTLIPSVRDLGLYHDDVVKSIGLLAPITTLLSLLAMCALFGGAWLLRKRAPLVTLGILWFFAGHALESTILPLELIHEHRNYLPDYGILLSLISLLLLPRQSAHKVIRTASLIGFIFASFLATVTWTRASQWSNKLSQTYYEAQHHPNSSRATYSYAAYEANLAMTGELKNWQKAFKDLETARAKETNVMPNVALIMLAETLRQPVKADWVQDAAHKLATKDITAEDVNAVSLLVKCTYGTCKKLPQHQIDAIFNGAFSNPRLSKHSYNYANILTVYINYLTHHRTSLGKLIAMMYQVVAAQPGIPQYRINLANALLVDGDIDGAKTQIAALRKMNAVGQLDEAIKNLEAQLTKLEAAKQKKDQATTKPPPTAARKYGRTAQTAAPWMR